MKLKQKAHNVQGNIVDSDEDTMMSFDPKSFGKLLNSLTRIYPNEHLAVMREYAANGVDAHAAAGQTRPIEITLPTPESPYLVMQDWGTGMTYCEIDGTYGVYGKSTKEETDDEFGYFGLGSKSALNICDSFTLTSVKDGEKSVVLIYRGQDQIGRLRKINVTRTDEPNGTIVSIPSDRFDDFREAAERIFPTWAKNSVLIDGEEPQYIDDNPSYDKIGELGYVGTTAQGRIFGEPKANLKVILGGITYRVGNLSKTQMQTVFGADDEISKELRAQEIMVRFENMSDLPILPSREEVAINEESLAAIGEKTQAMLKIFISEIKTKVDSAPMAMDAVALAAKYSFAVKPVLQTWQGKMIPETVTDPGMEFWIYDHNQERKSKAPPYSSRIKVDQNYKLLVVNISGCTISSPTILNHLKIWAKQKYVRFRNIALMDNASHQFSNVFAQSMVESGNIKFVNALEIIEFSLAYKKRLRRMAAPASPARSSVKYPSYVLEDSGIVTYEYSTADLISLGKPVFYFQQEKYGDGMASGMYRSNREDGIFNRRLKRVYPYLGNDAVVVMVAVERKSSVILSRLNGKVPVENGMTALKDKIFAAALNDQTSIADRLLASITKQNSAARFAFFDRDDMESTVVREIARRASAKDFMSSISALIADADLLLGMRESLFNEILAKRAKDEGVSGMDIAGNTILELFYQHYPLLGPIMAGMSYTARYMNKDKVENDLVTYINMVTRRDGEFAIS